MRNINKLASLLDRAGNYNLADKLDKIAQSYQENPQQAYNIYKDGFGGSILGNALSKYRLQVSMLKDNVQQGSFQI